MQETKFMEYAKALTFITEDPRWKEKLAVGTGVMLLSLALSPFLIGIAGIMILLGYSVRTMQNVRDGRQFPLPEWDQWSDDLARGFKATVVGIIWSLPAIVAVIPMIVGGFMASGNNDALTAIGAGIIGLSYCLLFLYSILLVALSPGIAISFARDESIGSGIRFQEIIAWTRSHVSEVLLFTIASIVVNIVLSFAGMIVGFLLICIGLVVTIPLASFVNYLYLANLLGQIAHKDRTGMPYYPPAASSYTPPVEQAPYTPAAPAPVEPETPVVAAEPEPPVAPATSDENAESDKPAL
jgi:hypothetical protein